MEKLINTINDGMRIVMAQQQERDARLEKAEREAKVFQQVCDNAEGNILRYLNRVSEELKKRGLRAEIQKSAGNTVKWFGMDVNNNGIHLIQFEFTPSMGDNGFLKISYKYGHDRSNVSKAIGLSAQIGESAEATEEFVSNSLNDYLKRVFGLS